MIARLEERIASLDRLLEERDRRYAAEWEGQRRETASAFQASETAVSKQEASQKDYNEKSNEFRQTLSDQAKTFVSNETYTARHDDLIRRIDSLEKTRDEHYGGASKVWENKRDHQWLIGATIASIGILMGLLFGVTGYIARPSGAVPSKVEIMNDEKNKVPVKQ